MKTLIFKNALRFSVLALFLCFSCGEKEDPELPLEDEPIGGVLKMKVNDVPWAAQWAYTITTPPDEEDDEDYYVVFITGSNGNYSAYEEEGEGDVMTFYIAIPKSKFNNPIGSYSLTGMEEIESDHPAAAIFNKIKGDESIVYISSDKERDGKVMGSISIESFKVGKQKMLGQELGQGYTELSGSFKIDEMTGFKSGSDVPVSGKIKMTEGKYEVKNGLNFGLIGMGAQGNQVEF